MEEAERGRRDESELTVFYRTWFRFSVRSCREGWVEESTDIVCSGRCLDNGSIQGTESWRVQIRSGHVGGDVQPAVGKMNLAHERAAGVRVTNSLKVAG